MIIRAVTLGLSLEWPPRFESFSEGGALLRQIGEAYRDQGHEVQTLRLACTPVFEALGADRANMLPRLAQEIESTAEAAGVGYTSLGPLRSGALEDGEAARFVDPMIDALVSTSTVFCTAQVADGDQIDYPAVRAAGRVIKALSESRPDGFDNLRFAAIANCPPGIPFFPAAYHDAGPPTYSLAVQYADDVTAAIAGDDSLAAGLNRVTHSVDAMESTLRGIAVGVEHRLGAPLAGIDRSPAPFPSPNASAAGILESVGVERFGEPGTLAAAMLMTRALRQTPGRHGFSGLMLPLLEDSGLAGRASEGTYSWTELLLYSAVCGTGLDTVPLPGDTSEETLASIVLDVAALSAALRKPLTCRLLPVPGKKAGERTTYDFPYFANAAVLDTKGAGAGKLLARAMQDAGR